MDPVKPLRMPIDWLDIALQTPFRMDLKSLGWRISFGRAIDKVHQAERNARLAPSHRRRKHWLRTAEEWRKRSHRETAGRHIIVENF